mmetsp:Transcript_27375/g.41219  ORF Transcript_27375/g.41219 Transcript_27375/m.41219 type:complete len:649 (+) Transcript_27375:52-1998(+)|eukprot:CAMPEP_0203673098 /NCGR_PEP_ID=MMETSP0090-20130426/10928_1 /ASSEMBLY_ACC=CAM_ASM_001088 /TAXON_ID=426623 /ORGANISM="Chaetoceros affinis, Strain CCMP159" /LENGTH=648 /DNA_ID=CAMNT_0050538647 /DNA_START=28 /DNA_END=1974 /DNA_ORIENTATION=-
MLQSYMRIALLFQLSASSAWAFTVVSSSPLQVAFGAAKSSTAVHLPTYLSAGSDDDDFYADYDPSRYESLNSPSNDGGYDDYSNNYRGGGYQQGRGGGGRGRGRGSGGGGGNFRYTRDTSRDNSSVDEGVIYDLLEQRSTAKRSRDFDTADAIRDDLLHNYAVGVDDRSKTWRSGCSASGSGMRFGGGGGGRGGPRGGRRGRKERDFGPNGHDYEQSTDAGPNTSSLSEGEIHGLLAQRLQAKMSRNFEIADGIQMDLIDAGVFVHDGMKEWRSDGVAYGDIGGGRGPGRTRGSYSDRNRPYVKSSHSGDVDGSDDTTIDALVMERAKFKIQRDFDKADAVREGLRTKFNVIIDDRLREWSVGGDFGEEHNMQREMAEKFANRGYAKSSFSLPVDEDNEETIQALVTERAGLKGQRNYEEADAIRDDLGARFDVVINDKLKEWSIGGRFGGSDNKKYRDYVKSSSSASLDAADEKAIEDALRERTQCKLSRDYESADAIRDDLRMRFNVIVDDREREWYVDGESDVSQNNRDGNHFDDEFEADMAKFEEVLSDEISAAVTESNEDSPEEEYEEYEEEEEEEYEESTLLSGEEEYEEEEDEQEETQTASPSRDELSSLTVVQLKDKLRENGLTVSGKKSELVDRLLLNL